MRRALLAACLLAPGFGGEGGLSVQAFWEEGGRLLRAEVSGAPPGAVVQVEVLRDRVSKGSRPLHLRQVRLGADAEGRAGGTLLAGSGEPGLYRVRASTGSGEAEGILGWKMGTAAHLEAILESEAFFRKVFDLASGFIAEVVRLQAAVEADRPKGLQAWKAWRERNREDLQAFCNEAFRRGGGYFPETQQKFCMGYLYQGMVQVEYSLYKAAESGAPHTWVGPGSDRTSLAEGDLDPYREMFRKESLWHWLSVMDALFQGATEDLAKRKTLRKDWMEMLDSWAEASKESKDLSDLGEACRAWLKAEEAQAPDAPALKAALGEAFRRLQKESGG